MAVDTQAQRNVQLQEDSAEILSQHGFAVEHNHTPKANGKKPDFRIGEGAHSKHWDHLNVTRSSARGVRKSISAKISNEQARRIVLRLDDSPVSSGEVVQCLKNQPKQGLEDLLMLDKGVVRRFTPGEAPVEAGPGLGRL